MAHSLVTMSMYERFQAYSVEKPRLRKFVGWFLVVYGFIALITPLSPGGLLFFVGLELLGLRFIGTDKLKQFLTKKKPSPVIAPLTIDPKKSSTP